MANLTKWVIYIPIFQKLREELLIMKKYILLCSVAMEAKLLLQLKERQHFVESSDIYTMRDLIDIHNDALLPELAQVHTSWAQHIKTDCEVSCVHCNTGQTWFFAAEETDKSTHYIMSQV